MSNGDATFHRWITRSRFRVCSTRRSRSEAGLCPCTRRAIAKRAEPTFELLRYVLGGNRPSQTDNLTLSRARINGSGLDNQAPRGGISPLAPHRLTPEPHSLPPILHVMHPNPLPGYSKGSRGLPVLLQITGICTGIEISLSPSLRQRPDRYAIDAGRNLPDKEFRYLRTVIVTAAVYWGFSSELRLTTNPSL